MEPVKSNFTKNLVEMNSLNFGRWSFESGMLFLAGSKWWGDKGPRAERHNGLDLLTYEKKDWTPNIIDPGTGIPIIYEGVVVRCIKDFLGLTLFAAHEIYEGDSRLFTIYGHVDQAKAVKLGEPLQEGAVIATLAYPSKNVRVLPHLHLSVALIPTTTPFENLSWELLGQAGAARFFDPAEII